MGKHNNDLELSRLEELHLQRGLKEVILEYIQALHAPDHPSNHGFALLVCRYAYDNFAAASRDQDRCRDRNAEYIMIRAIVYTEPRKQKWKLMAESSRAYFGITPALQEFSKDLERKMGDMTAVLSVGEKRLFSDRDEEFKEGELGDEDDYKERRKRRGEDNGPYKQK